VDQVIVAEGLINLNPITSCEGVSSADYGVSYVEIGIPHAAYVALMRKCADGVDCDVLKFTYSAPDHCIWINASIKPLNPGFFQKLKKTNPHTPKLLPEYFYINY
jgi:hypothetical protein